MSGIWNGYLEELIEYERGKEGLGQSAGGVSFAGCVDAAKAHLIDGLDRRFPWRLVITYNDLRAKELFRDLSFFDKDVWLYPAKDMLFFQADLQGNLLVRQRISVWEKLLLNAGGTVVTTMDGCMDMLPALSEWASRSLYARCGDALDLEAWKGALAGLGYERMGQVEMLGQYSVRGGILDIYPLNMEYPARMELWGDEIDSIRCFDPESQRSVENLEELSVYPAVEVLPEPERIREGMKKIEQEAKAAVKALQKQGKTEAAGCLKRTAAEAAEELSEGTVSGGLNRFIRYFYERTLSFIDYFPKDTCLVLDEPARLEEKARVVKKEFLESMSHRLEKGTLLPGQAEVLWEDREVFGKIGERTWVQLSALDSKTEYLTPACRCHLTVKTGVSYQNHFEELVKELMRWKREKYRVILISPSRTRAQRLAEDLYREYELNAFYSEDAGAAVEPGRILVTSGQLSRGYEYPMIKFAVITETDIFGGAQKKKRKKHQYEGKKIQYFSDLSVGDYVIHENHGMGIYRGVEKIQVGGVTKDYLKIEYADHGNLYIPVTQMDIVQKYADSNADRKPKLNRLGSKDWGQTKTRVKSAVKEIAKELVELYAARQKKPGFQYGPDTIWQKEFEEMFPYEETQDQLEAIEAAKRDMESPGIMDRLICGDVGFGKTEIAIRAAFKAVQDSKQVAYLVPTTILAQQHYNTFVQRMKDFPVHVELLSRFRTPSQQKTALEGLRKGSVDVVIGTHRLLSDDVKYKDLGLLIIDEEQRFGVTHKEKIKMMKENVDVLTLTATPIPRTLHMSMIGIRDMSVLEEPPLDRVPIQTYVMEYDEEMVREAINRELARGGQVYYVYNRVQDIDEITNKIAALVPDAEVSFIHGQMSERQVEKIMLQFINGEIDVLVTTTIIETGLDISNVNTIIIHDSDRYGLSQLYQLRGRVGRSNRTAYAFLMYRRNKLLKEVAEKRLQAIRDFTDLGSGIKIAMRDLEIRGAGNILGAQQHGHMEAVGYDLYCKLLNTAVKAIKGEAPEESFDTTVELDIDAYIPSEYIPNEGQKLEIYKRISGVENEEEYMDIQDEMIDRFGELPLPAQYLLKAALVKAQAHEANVTEVSGNKQKLTFSMYQRAPVAGQRIPPLIEKYQGKLRFVNGETPQFIYEEKRKRLMDTETMLMTVKVLLNEIKLLLEN